MEDLLTLFTGPSTSSSDVAVSESSLEFLDEIDGLEPMPITIASSTVLSSSTKGRATKKKKKRERDASKSSLEETKTENNNKKLKYDPLLPPNLKDLPSEVRIRHIYHIHRTYFSLSLLRSLSVHSHRRKTYTSYMTGEETIETPSKS